MNRAGYLNISGDEIRLTRAGFTVCDEIAEDILANHSVSVYFPFSDQCLNLGSTADFPF